MARSTSAGRPDPTDRCDDGEQGRARSSRSGHLWRIHAAFDLPSERLQLLRVDRRERCRAARPRAVVPGRDPHCRSRLLQAGTAGRVSARRVPTSSCGQAGRWPAGSTRHGQPLDLITTLEPPIAERLHRQPMKLWRHKRAKPLAVRLVAHSASPRTKPTSRSQGSPQGCQGGRDNLAGERSSRPSGCLLLTSLASRHLFRQRHAELYRARWRIEMAFKRLKSLIGLGGPPGQDAAGRKNLDSGSSADDLAARAAYRGGRGLSPLGSAAPRRLTAPTVWRLTHLAARSCSQPSPRSRRSPNSAAATNHRHLREPPRKRSLPTSASAMLARMGRVPGPALRMRSANRSASGVSNRRFPAQAVVAGEECGADDPLRTHYPQSKLLSRQQRH